VGERGRAGVSLGLQSRKKEWENVKRVHDPLMRRGALYSYREKAIEGNHQV